ncbi:NAD(P)-dependent oxidoreductase [Streptomyces canus]|uniref:NAD(P)-dependent oxidoreductase n=1 Tax=Streptomyces canus TaxID=58343 RepID=UPI00371E66C1
MIGAAELARMKPTATLVNTGSGGVVEEETLLTALRRGDLHSAGLDVTTGGPRTDPSDPLRNEPHLVALPHVGSATEATRAVMVELPAQHRSIAGRPPRTHPLPGTPSLPGRRAPQAG